MKIMLVIKNTSLLTPLVMNLISGSFKYLAESNAT